MIHIGLFEGIGGFSLASEWMGWKTYATSEINPFGQQVLKHYWPDAYHHGDIHTLTYETINTELSERFGTQWRDDEIILTGGFPCQPYSAAGKRLGKEDERHLWPEMLRTIREIQPTWVVGENVSGLVNWNGGMVFNEVQADLEAEGYEVIPFLLPACSVNAPHRRERVWFVAYTKSNDNRKQGRKNNCNGETIGRREPEVWIKPFGHGKSGNASNACNQGLQGSQRLGTLQRRKQEPCRSTSQRFEISTWNRWPTQSPICSRNDGISTQLSGITVSKHRNESIKAYGNAIVPHVVYQIFKAIEAYKTI